MSSPYDAALESLLREVLAHARGEGRLRSVRWMLSGGSWFGGSREADATATLACQSALSPRVPWMTPRFSGLVHAAVAGDGRAYIKADRVLRRFENDETRSMTVHQEARALRLRLALYCLEWQGPLDLLRLRLSRPEHGRGVVEQVRAEALRWLLFDRSFNLSPFSGTASNPALLETPLREHIVEVLGVGYGQVFAHNEEKRREFSAALHRFLERRTATEESAGTGTGITADAPAKRVIDHDVRPDLDSLITELAETAKAEVPDVLATARHIPVPGDDSPGPAVVTEEIEAGTLVVVPSLDHLPGHQRGTSYGDKHSPVAEFSGLAQKPVPLVACEDLPAARAELLAAFPWAADVVETVLRDTVGRSHLRLRPTVLVGPPGCGKTALARALGRELWGEEPTVYSCAGALDSSFGGTSRQWGTGRASVPLQAVRRTKTANPLIVLDEVEKGGRTYSNGNLSEALIPFLERETSEALFDLYLECPVNLSEVSYLATANSLKDVPAPLLSRLRVLHVEMPSREHLPGIAQRRLDAVRRDLGTTAAWVPDLTPEELGAIESAWMEMPPDVRSLRLVTRAVETVVATRERLQAWH